MPTSPAITIVLITRERLVRGDLSPGPMLVLQGLWQQPRPDLPDLAALVEAALHVGPRPARKVYVLTTDLWAQTHELPLHNSADVSGAELARALNFEAEALSGLSAFEAVVAQVPLGVQDGARVHWLVQARGADIDLIGDVVRRAGGRLMGVGHPGGLVRPAPAEARNRSWQRIELWPDAVVALRGTAAGPVDLQVFNSDPQMGRWRTEAQEWERKAERPEYKELLVAAGSDGEAAAEMQGLHLIWLNHPDALADWLLACGEGLARGRPAVPLLVPAPVPLSAGQRRGIAGVLALVAVALCGAAHLALSWDTQRRNAEQERLQEPATRLTQLEKQLKEADGQAAKLKEEADKFQRCADKLTAQRHRLAGLLRSLARHNSPDLLVQKIDNENGEPRIQGLCLQPELADHFAAWLAVELRATPKPTDGWDVQPPRKEARNLVGNGGPWHFEVTCKVPVDPADAAKLASGGASDPSTPVTRHEAH